MGRSLQLRLWWFKLKGQHHLLFSSDLRNPDDNSTINNNSTMPDKRQLVIQLPEEQMLTGVATSTKSG